MRVGPDRWVGIAADVTDFSVSQSIVTFVVDTGSVLSPENGVYWVPLPELDTP